MNIHNYLFRNTIRLKIISVLAILTLSLTIGALSSLYSERFLIISIALILFSISLFFLITKTETSVSILAYLMLTSLFFIPGFSLAGIGLRLDDVITIFLTLFILISVYKKSNYMYTPINKLIFVYACYVMSVTVIGISLNDLPSFLMFYSIKEVQYFVYFFSFIFVMKSKWNRENFNRIFMGLSLITMAWGAYQLLFDASVGFYGIGLISETSSSQSGGVFFLISIFFLYLINSEYRLKQRVYYYILLLGSIGMLFATISRTAIMAFLITYAIYIGFTLFRMSAKRIIISAYTLILTSPVIYFVLKDYLERIFFRMGHIDTGANVREQKWSYLLSHGSDFDLIFGGGRGFVQTITGGTTLAADSQYVRNFLEIGYIGSALFAIVIIGIVIFAFKNMKNHYAESLYLILITCGFMIMSVTHEVFLVTIQASFFWLLIGAFVGKIIYDKKFLKESHC